ncbi:MAG: biotin synthase BioB [Deltaproteobacteria bacterium]|nr:MAG: biotin synthase BioB [Deltaproteobacteria bacterium]
MTLPATHFLALAQRCADGATLDRDEALQILTARGSDLTLAIAGAHWLREQSFADTVELCSIINAKSGRCPENCAFCAQSAHHDTSAPVYDLKGVDDIVAGARQAAEEGSHCYGIVTSGTRIRTDAEWQVIFDAIRRIREETPIDPSASLGILTEERARDLAEAGCVTYHHNLETGRSFFPNICTTHDYEEDVETVRVAKKAGMKVCCGGIFGLGENLEQRYELGLTLRELEVDSVPVNFLNPVAGTPMEGRNDLAPLDCLRILVMLRYLMPNTKIAVCGGREPNLRDFQSWIFAAGASGTMVGNYLTTTGRDREMDLQMFRDAEVRVGGCCE